MRFNILSLGLVATVFMSASVRAIPVGEALGDVAGDIGSGGVRNAASDLGSGGVGDTAKGVTDAVASGNLGNSLTDGHITGDLVDCALGNGLDGAIGCVTASSDPTAAALKKRSLNLVRRKANEDEEDEDEDEEDENDKGKRKRSITGEPDEEEAEEEEPEENEIEPEENEIEPEENEVEPEENEVEPDEEEADELGDAEPAGRR